MTLATLHETDRFAWLEGYREAVEWAADETGLADESFPADCPYSSDEVLSRDFWPQ